HAILIGEPKIGEQHVKVLLLEETDGALNILGQIHVIPILQRSTEPLALGFLVIHDEQSGFHAELIMHGCFQEPGSALVQREHDSETGASADATFQFDAAAMSPDYPLDDHQAETRAFLFSSVKWLEDAVDLLLGNPSTGVSHTHPNLVGRLA